MFDRQKISMISAELLGTFILASVALAASSYFTFTAPWYAALSVGLTLAVLVAVIGKASGAHVNPAISVGLWTMRKITLAQMLVYIGSQMLGGVLALFFYEYVTNTNTEMVSSVFEMRSYIAELIGAAIFGFGVAAVVSQKFEGMYAAFGIGFSLFLGVVVAAVAAPGFLNPAVAFANGAFNWTVLTAPILGAVVGMNMYNLLIEPSAGVRVTTKRRK